ncbi:MAG TPA: fibronectin type III domain-containing protein [Verrucomicrobiae bacterium]|nr:fibronectin type III domain-containing protein [Verrucomicrobiae bacterium]
MSTIWITVCAVATAQENATLTWNASTDSHTSGYYVYYGTDSHQYLYKVNAGAKTSFSVTNLPPGMTFYFAVSSYSSQGVEGVPSSEVSLSPLYFLAGSGAVSSTVEYLQFPDGVVFGYYDSTSYPWVYHFDMGWEYFMDAGDGQGGVYLYDCLSNTFWFTAPSLFPYLYDFTLNSWLYYYPNSQVPGTYTSNPRYFYDFGASQIITK